jgi:hypothetical protein
MSLPRATQPRAGTLSAMKTPSLLIFFLVFLSGCTVVGHERVEGWPALEIVEHHVPHHVMRNRCAPYAPPLMNVEACAQFDFAARKCHIWFSADFPPPQAFVDHERLHCQGYDHVGEAVMAQMWSRYLSVQQAGLNASAGASNP